MIYERKLNASKIHLNCYIVKYKLLYLDKIQRNKYRFCDRYINHYRFLPEVPVEFPVSESDLWRNKTIAHLNERKSEQANILHATTLLENAAHNKWQFQALVMGNWAENHNQISIIIGYT